MTRILKRSLAAIALAAAVSTLGPAASAFFAFSNDFRSNLPDRGGTSTIYKNGDIPGWIVEAMTRAYRPTESALNSEGQPTNNTAPL